MKAFFLFWAFWCMASVAFSQNSYENKEEFRDVAGELRCPTCTGLSVLESDASFSVEIKEIVRDQLKEGKTKEQILSYFVERYGPWILREPPKQGFNLVAWLVPFAVLILGPIVIWVVVWRRKVSVSTFGVRDNDVIINEMHKALSKMRESNS